MFCNINTKELIILLVMEQFYIIVELDLLIQLKIDCICHQILSIIYQYILQKCILISDNYQTKCNI